MKDKNSKIVSVFFPYWGSENPYQDELAKSLESHGVIVERSYLKKIFRNVIFRRLRLDIIHVHWLRMVDLWPLSLIKTILIVLRLSIMRILGIKLVWTVHDLRPHESIFPKLDWLQSKYVTMLANAIIVHTESAKKEIMSVFHFKKNIYVIPHSNVIHQYENTIEQSTARNKLNIPYNTTVMLFFGSIRPYKGVYEMIETFKVLQRELDDIYLIIAGRAKSNKLDAAIRQKIDGHRNIQYISEYVQDKEVQVYMNACDVCVFPYKYILTSGAVILAMSFGKACIAPKLDFFCDTLNGKGAFLYDLENKNGLINAMRQTIKKRSQLKQMGDYNREQVLKWNWQTAGQETKRVYQNCLSLK